jgi:hypothetical protein
MQSLSAILAFDHGVEMGIFKRHEPEENHHLCDRLCYSVYAFEPRCSYLYLIES